jgi:hypothetical protein
MKRVIILATSYPYTAGVLAIMWICTALLLKIDSNLQFDRTIVITTISTMIIAMIGFRK